MAEQEKKPKNSVKPNRDKKIKLSWRYLLNTRRYMVAAAALAVGALLILGAAIYPQIMGSMDKYQEMVTAQKRLARLRVKASQLDQYQDSSVLAQQEQINLVLPTQKPLLELLSGLYYLAQQTGVEFTDLSLSPGKITGEEDLKGSYGKIEVSLIVEGNFVQVNQFLEEIERLAPLTTVVEMTLNEKGNSQNNQDVTFEADLTVETYYFNKEVTSKVDTPVPEFKSGHEELLTEISSYTYVGPNLSQNLIDNFLQGSGVDDLFGVTNPVTSGLGGN